MNDLSPERTFCSAQRPVKNVKYYSCGEQGHISYHCKNREPSRVFKGPTDSRFQSSGSRFQTNNSRYQSIGPSQRYPVSQTQQARFPNLRWKPYGQQKSREVTAAVHEYKEESDNEKEPIIVKFVRGGDEVVCGVNGTKLTFMIDSGCPVNLITRKALQLIESRKGKISLRPQHKEFTAYATHQPLNIDGCFDAAITFGDKTEDEQINVAAEGKCCLLGNETAKKLKILSIQTQVSGE